MKSIVMGVDIGHGESSVAFAKVCTESAADALPPPKDVNILEGKCVIPSVYSVDNIGQEFIGEVAISNGNGAQSLAICFKKRPSAMNSDEIKIVCGFFKNVVERALKQAERQLEDINDTIEVVVGCPSAWSRDEIFRYSEMLSAAIGHNVKVKKESNAAIVYSLTDSNSEISHPCIEQGVLIIDVGSSTTDITYYREKDEPVNIGFDLGAARIEYEILDSYLHSHSDAQQILSNNDVLSGLLLYACRVGKENFFSNITSCDSYSKFVSERIISGLYLEIEVHKEFMTDIIRKPLSFNIDNSLAQSNAEEKNMFEYIASKILGVSSLPNNNIPMHISWEAYCKKILTYLSEYLKQTDRNVSAVILTGGASRMYFIREQVKDIFRNFKDIHFVFDQSPSTCISRGLAVAGRADIRAENKKQNIFNSVKQILSDDYDSLVSIMGEKMSVQIFDTVVKPGLVSWKNRESGYITLNDMARKIKDNGSYLKNDTRFQNKVSESLISWIEKNAAVIDKRVNDEFAKEFGMVGKYVIGLSDKLKKQVAKFNSDGMASIDANNYVDFNLAANITNVITTIVLGIVLGIVGWIVSYIVVIIIINIIVIILLSTSVVSFGTTAVIAGILEAASPAIAIWITSYGGDLFATIASKCGEKVANGIKSITGDPENKDFTTNKRGKYYNKLSEKFSDMKQDIKDKIVQAINDNPNAKSQILDGTDAIIRDSIENAMRYVSLDI